MSIPNKSSDIYASMLPLLDTLGRSGSTVMAIDPSIGSTSSQPAYAIYVDGELIHAEKASINPKAEQWDRLQTLGNWVRLAYKNYRPDVLVYEDIPDQRYMPMINGRPMATGHNVKAHASLLKSVGAILSINYIHGDLRYLPLRPQVWKARISSSYVKGDIADAVEMGRIVIDMAKEMLDSEIGSTTNARSRIRRNSKESASQGKGKGKGKKRAL